MFSTYYAHKYNYLTVIKGIRKWLMFRSYKTASGEKLLWLHSLQLTAYTGQFRLICILHTTDTHLFQHWIMNCYIKLKLYTTQQSPLEQLTYSYPKDATAILKFGFWVFLLCIFLIRMLKSSHWHLIQCSNKLLITKLRNGKMDTENMVPSFELEPCADIYTHLYSAWPLNHLCSPPLDSWIDACLSWTGGHQTVPSSTRDLQVLLNLTKQTRIYFLF